MTGEFTLKGAMVRDIPSETCRFSFLCDLCDRSYTTRPLSSRDLAEAQRLARGEARRYFNRCHRCQRWVCDTHYQADYMLCTLCTKTG